MVPYHVDKFYGLKCKNSPLSLSVKNIKLFELINEKDSIFVFESTSNLACSVKVNNDKMCTVADFDSWNTMKGFFTFIQEMLQRLDYRDVR